jgi:putative hemin transport protein
MTDTHEFFQLLRHHRVTRTQALVLAGAQRARRVGNDSLHQVLHRVARDQFRIMTFIGNRGCLQIFSGAVEQVARSGPWLNILDTEHNLHLREDRISTCWVVRKPTRTGIVSSLELYDDAGETIALVFRKRDDREAAEDPRWSQLLSELAEVP